jgi:hypothetical protein
MARPGSGDDVHCDAESAEPGRQRSERAVAGADDDPPESARDDPALVGGLEQCSVGPVGASACNSLNARPQQTNRKAVIGSAIAADNHLVSRPHACGVAVRTRGFAERAAIGVLLSGKVLDIDEMEGAIH